MSGKGKGAIKNKRDIREVGIKICPNPPLCLLCL